MKTDLQIVEVGPRDGLQNEKAIVPTDIKLELIQRLMASGLTIIEATSFVSPKWVPQMADHEMVVLELPKSSKVHFPVLVPNQQGLDTAVRLNVKDIAVIAAASESFSQKNINRSIEKSLDEYTQIIRQALDQGMRVRGYVSCALGCPYEGKVAISQVVHVAKSLYTAGCYEIALSDTIGIGTALAAKEMIKAVTSEIPVHQLAVHFHDTYGQALANILAALEVGVRTVDSSVAGLGGCPYAKGATGNVATEEVVYLCEGMGLKTGVNLDKLIKAGNYICQILNIENRSKVAVAFNRTSKED